MRVGAAGRTRTWDVEGGGQGGEGREQGEAVRKPHGDDSSRGRLTGIEGSLRTEELQEG